MKDELKLSDLRELVQTSLHHKDWDERIEGLMLDALLECTVDMLNDKGVPVNSESLEDASRYCLAKIELMTGLFKKLPEREQIEVSIVFKSLWRRRMSLATPEQSASAHAAGELARFFMKGSKQLREHPSSN